MPRKTKVVVSALVTIVVIFALSATAAIAAVAYSVNLTPTKSTLHYGEEFDLAPSVVGTDTLAFSTIALEKSWDGVNWNNTGLEGLKAEGDTGTVVPFDPQALIIDGSFLPEDFAGTLPATVWFRGVYKPAGTNGKAISGAETTSAPVAITLVRNTKVKVTTSVPKKAKRNKRFTVRASVSPNCGPGVVRVTVTKKGFKRTYLVATDEDGQASVGVKLPRGTYKVQERWLGNVWGVSAKSSVKTVIVR